MVLFIFYTYYVFLTELLNFNKIIYKKNIKSFSSSILWCICNSLRDFFYLLQIFLLNHLLKSNLNSNRAKCSPLGCARTLFNVFVNQSITLSSVSHNVLSSSFSVNNKLPTSHIDACKMKSSHSRNKRCINLFTC